MKKVLVLLVLISLVLPMLSKAQPLSKEGSSQSSSSTIIGTITSINSEEKSFELKIGGLALRIRGFFAALFSFGRTYSLVYKVLTDENTQFTKKSTTGVVSSSFSDLTPGLRVQVKGQMSSSSDSTYRGIIKANSVFILTPSSTTPPVGDDICYKDEDCTWCGIKDCGSCEGMCVSKEYLSTQKIECTQVTPPEGISCSCDKVPNIANQVGKCTKVGRFQPTIPTTPNKKIPSVQVCVSQKTQNKLTVGEALRIAERDCKRPGWLYGVVDPDKENNCDPITGTWWFGYVPDKPIPWCNPACVVNIDTKKAKIELRCTSSTSTTSTTSTTIPVETTSSCEVKCDMIGTRFEGWYLICQNPISGQQTKQPIKWDKCKNCEALCKYQHARQEGWYNSCNGRLILRAKCSK